jgi:hypothetical protein
MPEDLIQPESGLEVTSVDHLPEYVIGFPIYVAITIRADLRTAYPRLPFANLLNLKSCIGVEVSRLDGTVISRELPTPIIDRQLGNPGAALEKGESRRMLTDVSPLVPITLSQGNYSVRFAYAAARENYYWANPVKITFRNPNQAEAAWLSSLAVEREKFFGWADWTYTAPEGSVFSGAITEDNPLKLNLLLRLLFFGPTTPAQVDPAITDVLTGVYEPEGKALKVELYQARGDQANYQRTRDEILRQTPGLGWWMRRVDQKAGFLASFRVGLSNSSKR